MTGEKQTRELLFPSQATMPPGCPIKGTVALRAKATGHVGIFHLASCRTYLRTRTVNRWFCSEDDARAAGFRKAINC